MLTVNSLKQFLKPDWRNIIFTIILLSVTTLLIGKSIPLPSNVPTGLPHWRYGFPIEYFEIHSFRGIIKDFINISSVSLAGLFFNIIFWYLISCLLISAWGKIKNKKQ